MTENIDGEAIAAPTKGPPGVSVRARAGRSGRPWLLIVPALLVTLFGVAYPLILSFWYGLTSVEAGQRGFAWFFSNSVYIEIMQRTFVTAVVAVVLCIALGYPFAYLITISGRRTRGLLLAVAIVPFWISGLVRVFSWLVILQPNGVLMETLPGSFGEDLLRSQNGVLIGLTQVLLPFMILPIYSVTRSIDLNLITAAESLGARRSTAFFRIFVPLSLPGVFAGALVVTVLAIGFYVLPQILGSPQQALIGQAIYTQASTLSNIGRAGAMSSILLGSTLLLILAAASIRKLLVRGPAA